MKYEYVKVNKSIAAALGLLNYRKEMRDGTILLNQKDVMNGDGASLEEIVALIGGVIISEEEALLDAAPESEEAINLIEKEVDNDTESSK